jgi:hypothetical protein
MTNEQWSQLKDAIEELLFEEGITPDMLRWQMNNRERMQQRIIDTLAEFRADYDCTIDDIRGVLGYIENESEAE